VLVGKDSLKTFESFLIQFEKDNSWKEDLLDIDEYKIENIEGAAPHWFMYHMHSLDFVREIVFSLNRFRYYIAKLLSWGDIIKLYSDKDKLDLLIDFIYPLAIVSIDYPYKIKNKIIYSACYLCHFSNFLLKKRPVVKLPRDWDIDHNVFAQMVCGWSKYKELDDSLAAVNSSSFREKTYNFRNSEHHSIPPKIEIGQSRLLRRISSEKGKYTFTFGGQQPLPIKFLVSLLEQEHINGLKAFKSFCVLMQEQRELFECNLTTGWS